MSTDDVYKYPHVVIVETPSSIKIVEFENDTKPSPGGAAHDYAMNIAMGENFYGRIIVTMRIRTMQPYSYAKATDKSHA